LSGAPRGDDADVTYGSYLALDQLLALQHPRSVPEHSDELLFIVVHQASELWFKEILHELDALIDVLSRGEAEFALFRMGRINALMRIVSAQLSALETLPPQHFAEFRRHLGTSSGSQSVQFRAIEAVSGLREPHFMAMLAEHGEIPALVQRARSRPTLQELYLALLRDRGVELEALFVGVRADVRASGDARQVDARAVGDARRPSTSEWCVAGPLRRADADGDRDVVQHATDARRRTGRARPTGRERISGRSCA
jgi:tryptophan 2,3-dioxygenase